MKINDRVNHAEFGAGTIVYILNEETTRESILVNFDVSNSRLNDGLGLTKPQHGLFCDSEDLEPLHEN